MTRLVVVPGTQRHAVLTGLAALMDLQGSTIRQETQAARRQLRPLGTHEQLEAVQQWLRSVTSAMITAMAVIVCLVIGGAAAVISTGNDWLVAPAVVAAFAPTVANVLLWRSTRRPVEQAMRDEQSTSLHF